MTFIIFFRPCVPPGVGQRVSKKRTITSASSVGPYDGLPMKVGQEGATDARFSGKILPGHAGVEIFTETRRA